MVHIDNTAGYLQGRIRDTADHGLGDPLATIGVAFGRLADP